MTSPFATRNFSQAEFTELHVSENGGRAPADMVARELPPLMEFAQRIRDLAGVPGIVTSWWRTLAHNTEIGGAKDSRHEQGQAADITFVLTSIREHARRVLQAVRLGELGQFGQVIFYADTGHVHISTFNGARAPRNNQVLYSPGKDTKGERIYRPLTDPDRELPIIASNVAGGLSRSQRSRVLLSARGSTSPDAGGDR